MTTSTAHAARAAQSLIVAALVVTAVLTVVIARSGWADGDGMVITGYGVPMGCVCLFALWAERGIESLVAPLVIGVTAAGLLVLSLPALWPPPPAITGDSFLPVPPLLLLVAALVSWNHRRALADGDRPR